MTAKKTVRKKHSAHHKKSAHHKGHRKAGKGTAKTGSYAMK